MVSFRIYFYSNPWWDWFRSIKTDSKFFSSAGVLQAKVNKLWAYIFLGYFLHCYWYLQADWRVTSFSYNSFFQADLLHNLHSKSLRVVTLRLTPNSSHLTDTDNDTISQNTTNATPVTGAVREEGNASQPFFPHLPWSSLASSWTSTNRASSVPVSCEEQRCAASSPSSWLCNVPPPRRPSGEAGFGRAWGGWHKARQCPQPPALGLEQWLAHRAGRLAGDAQQQ